MKYKQIKYIRFVIINCFNHLYLSIHLACLPWQRQVLLLSLHLHDGLGGPLPHCSRACSPHHGCCSGCGDSKLVATRTPSAVLPSTSFSLEDVVGISSLAGSTTTSSSVGLVTTATSLFGKKMLKKKKYKHIKYILTDLSFWSRRLPGHC